MSEKRVRFGSIWAEDRNGIIGTGHSMLWSVPADQQFFKNTTMGAPMVMGRASWEAQGGALPGRANIVVTRDQDYKAEGALVVHTLHDAFELAAKEARKVGADHAWITGGGNVYEQTMDRVDELIVSELDFAVPDSGSDRVRAPNIDAAVWQVDEARSDTEWRPKSGDARWKVTTYVRRETGGESASA